MNLIGERVVIIGGGATGTGILRDLALRGIPALLVEQEDLAHGTSSRFHGLLHSGARYALKDQEAARECLEENLILRRIAPSCIELTGGVFVSLPEDEKEYVEQWIRACKQVGMEPKEISTGELIKANPALNSKIEQAFEIPDSAVDGFRVIWGNVNSAREYGARIMTYTKVNAIYHTNGAVCAVEVTNKFSGQKTLINCELIINAAGAWAGEVAALAGVNINVIKDKGTLLAFNHRLVNKVVNRLRLPGDGDIFVPHGTITILGTTSLTVDDPTCTEPGSQEVLELLDIGKQMIPNLESYRLIRAFAGVRPLYHTGSDLGGRTTTRNFALLDHGKLDELQGLISIVGGKFTTFRLMAERTVDLAVEKLGVDAPCRTAKEPLTVRIPADVLKKAVGLFGKAGAQRAAARLGNEFTKVVAEAAQNSEKAKMFCECELVTLAEIDHAAQNQETFTLGDILRKTRTGMGTCQGTFCGYRTIGALNRYSKFGNSQLYLKDFLQKRWNGIRPVLWGQQLREAQLSTGIYCSLFGMERMK